MCSFLSKIFDASVLQIIICKSLKICNLKILEHLIRGLSISMKIGIDLRRVPVVLIANARANKYCFQPETRPEYTYMK